LRCFVLLGKECNVAIQTFIFQMRNLFVTVNYLAYIFLENFDVTYLKFERVVLQLLKCLGLLKIIVLKIIGFLKCKIDVILDLVLYLLYLDNFYKFKITNRLKLIITIFKSW